MGVFNYGGGRVSGDLASVSFNQIRVADSEAGYSEAPFTDLTIGEGLQAGYGVATAATGDDNYFFLGLGDDVGVVNVTLSGFVSRVSGEPFVQNSFGVSGDAGFLAPLGLNGGVGVYVNTNSLTSVVDRVFH